MQKQLYEFSIGIIQKIKKPLRSGMIAQTIALLIGMADPSSSRAAETTRENRDKIAEMTALVRHSEHCPEVPRLWTTSYLMLLIMAPPTEEQVAEKEREMLALRDKIGTEKWCQLYSVEMEQAYIIYRLARQR